MIINEIAKIGCGYNCAYFNWIDGESPIGFPSAASFLELGLSELLKFNEIQVPDEIELSLHLARTPMLESLSARKNYISYIKSILKKLDSHTISKIISIGIHLTGSRFLGAGLYGAADDYAPTDANLEKVVSFVAELRDELNLEVWIENANIYSKNINEILNTWTHVERICSRGGCKVIIDLAHLIAEMHNVSIPGISILSSLPWQSVSEIHLSGIVAGSDGCMHDGHGSPIHQEVWDILGPVITYLDKMSPILPLFTIEHTMPNWIFNKNQFYNDFHRLKTILENMPILNAFKNRSKTDYMKGYLRYYILGRIANLEGICRQKKIPINSMISDWSNQIVSNGKRIVFDINEVPDEERVNSVDLVPCFLEYFKSEICKKMD